MRLGNDDACWAYRDGGGGSPGLRHSFRGGARNADDGDGCVSTIDCGRERLVFSFALQSKNTHNHCTNTHVANNNLSESLIMRNTQLNIIGISVTEWNTLSKLCFGKKLVRWTYPKWLIIAAWNIAILITSSAD